MHNAAHTSLPLHQRAVLVSLNISRWGDHKIDEQIADSVTSTHGTSERIGSFRKQLLDKAALKTIRALDSQARQCLYKYSLPGRIDGERILSALNYEACRGELQRIGDERKVAVDSFISEFEHYKNAQASKLGSLFRATDYPTEQELSESFDFEVFVDPLPGGSIFNLPGIDENALVLLRLQYQSHFQSALSAAMRSPFERLQGVVSKFVKTLEKAELDVIEDRDYIPKFKNTLVTNITDLLDIMPGLNLTSDPQLEAYAEEVRSKLTRFTPSSLRQDSYVRKEALNEALTVMSKLAKHSEEKITSNNLSEFSKAA